MSRSADARLADVRRLLDAAREIRDDRARLAPAIARDTGLSLEGVELGFQSLERDAPDDDLRALVDGAGTADHVHVVLAANVFVAPLRAIAIARAAADRVTVRPSRRDPTLARALVERAGDGAIALTAERDVLVIGADQVHVYGHSETVATVRARAPRGTTVRGHGAGMGVAWVTLAADLADAADRLSEDVVAFDQRGCLSPRIAIVEGNETRALLFAQALDDRLRSWADRIPRGTVFEDERADAARWRDAMAFAGRVWGSSQSTVALAPAGAPLIVPPPGRHVHVVSEPTLSSAAARIGPIGRFVVALGTDDPSRGAALVAPHVRLSRLGRMQHPPLDGPVDRRSHEEPASVLTRRPCPG
jgi:hypothetical protein